MISLFRLADENSAKVLSLRVPHDLFPEITSTVSFCTSAAASAHKEVPGPRAPRSSLPAMEPPGALAMPPPRPSQAGTGTATAARLSPSGASARLSLSRSGLESPQPCLHAPSRPVLEVPPDHVPHLHKPQPLGSFIHSSCYKVSIHPRWDQYEYMTAPWLSGGWFGFIGNSMGKLVFYPKVE